LGVILGEADKDGIANINDSVIVEAASAKFKARICI